MEQVTPFGALASRRHRRPRWLRERAAHKGGCGEERGGREVTFQAPKIEVAPSVQGQPSLFPGAQAGWRSASSLDPALSISQLLGAQRVWILEIEGFGWQEFHRNHHFGFQGVPDLHFAVGICLIARVPNVLSVVG